jgi:hypothetical protein
MEIDIPAIIPEMTSFSHFLMSLLWVKLGDLIVL